MTMALPHIPFGGLIATIATIIIISILIVVFIVVLTLLVIKTKREIKIPDTENVAPMKQNDWDKQSQHSCDKFWETERLFRCHSTGTSSVGSRYSKTSHDSGNEGTVWRRGRDPIPSIIITDEGQDIPILFYTPQKPSPAWSDCAVEDAGFTTDDTDDDDNEAAKSTVFKSHRTNEMNAMKHFIQVQKNPESQNEPDDKSLNISGGHRRYSARSELQRQLEILQQERDIGGRGSMYMYRSI